MPGGSPDERQCNCQTDLPSGASVLRGAAARQCHAAGFGNSGWYLYLDLIGSGPGDDAGQSLTSNWYARNLQIFANIARNLRPGDRAVVFIGAGHAAMLRPMIDTAPFLRDVDPEKYLPAAK